MKIISHPLAMLARSTQTYTDKKTYMTIELAPLRYIVFDYRVISLVPPMLSSLVF